MASSPGGSDASHESDNDGEGANTSKQSSNKDKECPYCHQKFTSSSLGRHLDQFIHKKKPDGIHDVEEIKKLRAGITRRTARGKKGEHDQHDGSDRHVQDSPSQSSNTGPTPAFLESLNRSLPGTNDVRFNRRMGWQSTGVITNDAGTGNTQTATVPSPSLVQSSNLAAGAKRSFSTYAADLPASATETTRALELSLREVLDAVGVVMKKTTPLPEPFPFDLTTMTFPALCLALLPAPATLFQSSPFATNATIPLKPPGFEQLEALRQKVRITLDQWKWDALAHVQRFSAGVNVADEAEKFAQVTQDHITTAMRHLDHSFQFFMSHPPEQQYNLWSVELLRAYKTEQDKLIEANEHLARISQEANQLQQQIDHLSRCQWPREMALWPPERNTFSSVVQKGLQDHQRGSYTTLDTVRSYGKEGPLPHAHSALEDKWDFDKLVNKWKRHIREDRARGARANSMLPPVDHPERTDTPPAGLRKAASEAAGTVATLENGHIHSHITRPSSTINSPNIRNGASHYSSAPTSTADKPTAFGSSSGSTPAITNAQQKPFAGTPPLPISSRMRGANTPSNHPMSNVHIISDVDDHMARFRPWYMQQKEQEELRRREDEEDDSGG